MKKENNYTFIDTQNIIRGVQRLGWDIDWNKFHIYLKDKFHSQKSFLFLGYLPQYEKQYQSFRDAGFDLVFKEVYNLNGKKMGNIDVELTMQVLIDIDRYDKAVMVSGDGDFHSLIKYLKNKDKFRQCISTTIEETSVLIRKSTEGNILFMTELKDRVAIVNT